ncbi:MAG: hypothetical protein J07HX64_02248 [halophilic archaeon J07HX64]|nr:MAG: hypothetical protein J07HX64_02248 [halophilic archaeon J07HX64]
MTECRQHESERLTPPGVRWSECRRQFGPAEHRQHEHTDPATEQSSQQRPQRERVREVDFDWCR